MLALQKEFLKENFSHEWQWVIAEAEKRQKENSISSVEDYVRATFDRRKSGEALAYIFGHVPFLGLNLAVGPGVLIPRPETEELAENIYKKIAAKSRYFEHWNIVDFGAGSGCLGLAIVESLLQKNILPSEKVSLHLVENSAEALVYLKKNVEALFEKFRNFKNNCHISPTSWNNFSPSNPLQVIVSNPPYISGLEGRGYSGESDEADSNVIKYEPSSALYPADLAQYPDASGPYRDLLKISSLMLASGGIGGFELGPAQATWIENFSKENFLTLRGNIEKDMSGKDRFFYFSKA